MKERERERERGGDRRMRKGEKTERLRECARGR